MTAREEILAAVRAARPPVVAYPDIVAMTVRDPGASDGADRFEASARAAAAAVVFGARVDVARLTAEVAPSARQVLSHVTELAGNVYGSMHDLAHLDLFVCEAAFGVAENGAVWLTDSRLGERAALFLATHVIVVLDRAAIVENMHEAYARIGNADESFGIFVAGPSKTADIEQALVIGAHGAKRLTVVVVS